MSNLSAAFFLFEAASNIEIDDKRFYVVDQSNPDYIHQRIMPMRTKQVFQVEEDMLLTRCNLLRLDPNIIGTRVFKSQFSIKETVSKILQITFTCYYWLFMQ